MTGSHIITGAPPPGGRRRGALLQRLADDRRGASAIEFALIGSIFVVLLLNVVDFAILIWSRMQVDYAAAAGAQAAYNTCSPGQMPATAKCLNMPNVVTVAVKSTSLGNAVALNTSAERPGLSEGYYCTIGNDLRFVGDTTQSKPLDCAPDNPDPTAVPGDYLTVNVNYTFAPLVSGLSLVPGQTLEAMAIQRLQ
jgi:Flp pilus assembly protein TadG